MRTTPIERCVYILLGISQLFGTIQYLSVLKLAQYASNVVTSKEKYEILAVVVPVVKKLGKLVV